MADFVARTIANKSQKMQGDGYNLVEGLRAFRNAVADVDKNPVKIVGIGDSIMYGKFSSDIMNTSWAGRLRTSLQAQLGDVGKGFIPIPSNNLPDQPQWTNTGTWTISTNLGVSGRYMKATGSGNSTSVTFTGTSVDLIYPKGSAGAQTGVTITIDGNPVTAPNFYNASGGTFGNVQNYSGLSSGSHTMVITTPSTGTVYIEGIIAYNPIASGKKGCYFLPFASPSASTSWFTQTPSLAITVGKNPHLVIMALGVNDSSNDTDTNNYVANMGTLISQYKNAGASVLLLTYYDIGGSDTVRSARYKRIVDMQYQLADIYNCALVDIYSRWGKSFTLAQTNGLMGTTDNFNGLSGPDPYHPSDKGHRDIASAITKHLIGGIA